MSRRWKCAPGVQLTGQGWKHELGTLQPVEACIYRCEMEEITME